MQIVHMTKYVFYSIGRSTWLNCQLLISLHIFAMILKKVKVV